MDYRQRILDTEMTLQLEVAGAVLVKGPKGCGKTETARAHAKSEILIDDSPSVRVAMDSDPAYLLQGETPRLIDEWQEQPILWNTVRHEVDRRRSKGQFILTGSSTPRDDQLSGLHSGVGRYGVVSMDTMTWAERGWSTSEVSLREVLDGASPTSMAIPADLSQIATNLCIGGWPGNLELTTSQSLRANNNYFDLMTEVDLARVGGVRKDPDRMRRIMTSIARNISTECEISTIMADANGTDGQMDRATVVGYLSILERLMVSADLPAWSPSIRSRARLRKASKRHFCDPSVACMALGLTPDRLCNDLEYLGLLFESAALHDIKVYARAAGARMYHYRDSNGLEADAILEFRDGSWAAIEVKLGFGAVEEAATSLTKVAATIDQTRIGPPRALLVVTGSGFAHRRPDGVSIAPLAALTA
jgi:predicted AAA+ superfamily ATPase